MSSEGVIRIKGDTKELISSLEKAGVKFQQLGQHAERAVGHSKSFGQAWEHANNRMIRTVAHATSIGGAIHLAVEAMKEFQEASTKASETLDSAAIKRERAAHKIGISPLQAEGLVSGDSIRSKAEREAYFAKSSDAIHGKQRMKRIAQRQSAFNAGYSEEEISQAEKHGGLSKLTSGAFYGSLSEEGKGAYDTEVDIRRAEDQAEESEAKGGRQRRLNEARYRAVSARQTDPILRSLARNRISLMAAEEFGLTNDQPAVGMFEVRKAIETQTDELQPRPTVAGKAH